MTVAELLEEIKKKIESAQKEADRWLMIVSSLEASHASILETLDIKDSPLTTEMPITSINPIQDKVTSDFYVKYKDLNKATTYTEKVRFVLSTEQRFLHKKEIAEILNKLDDSISVDDYTRKVAGALFKMKEVKGNDFVAFQVGKTNANSFWGRIGWLNENKEIKPEHQINRKYLFNQKAKQA